MNDICWSGGCSRLLSVCYGLLSVYSYLVCCYWFWSSLSYSTFICGSMSFLSWKDCSEASGGIPCSSWIFWNYIGSLTCMTSFLYSNCMGSKKCFHPMSRFHLIHNLSCHLSITSQKLVNNHYWKCFFHCCQWCCHNYLGLFLHNFPTFL